MRTFAISDVAPSSRPLPATTLVLSLEERVGSGVEASGANQVDLVHVGKREMTHPFVEAIHVAFAEHYPLVLAPDDVWLCVAQGFGLHVEANAAALRSRFVRHDGKRALVVRRDQFVKGSPDNDWQGCFSAFSDQIAEHIGKKRDLIVASFSTTGSVERAASEIVLMSAMQSYFDFRVHTMCGLPSMTLLGTVEDWCSIRRRAEVLAEFDLANWITALLPVLDQFVAAAAGDADPQFWQSIYKRDGGSGGPYVNGWINVLFPYLDGGGDWSGVAMRPRPNKYATAWMDTPPFGGTTVGAFPRGMSRIPFIWEYLETKFPMVFWGGFSGISQDRHTRAVRPAIGWAVQNATARRRPPTYVCREMARSPTRFPISAGSGTRSDPGSAGRLVTRAEAGLLGFGSPLAGAQLAEINTRPRRLTAAADPAAPQHDFAARGKDFNDKNFKGSYPEMLDALAPDCRPNVGGCSATTHYEFRSRAALKAIRAGRKEDDCFVVWRGSGGSISPHPPQTHRAGTRWGRTTGRSTHASSTTQ